MTKTIPQIVVIFVLAATLTVAVLGFVLMSEPGHMMVGCFGAGVCSALGPIEHFESHLTAFQSVSTGIAKTFAAFVALLLAVALSASLTEKNSDERDTARIRVTDNPPLSRTPLLHWLTLHEKRDPSFACAMNS